MRRTATLALALALLTLTPACQLDPAAPDTPPQTTAQVKTLTLTDNGTMQAAELHGANGIAVKNRDVLTVGSLFGRQIDDIDVHQGDLLARLGPDKGVQGPGDLAYGPDGSLYWTNFWTGDLNRRTPEGLLITVAVGQGAGPLAVAPDGAVAVARRVLGEGLTLLDAGLAPAKRDVALPFTVGGLAYDPRGRLYATSWHTGELYRVRVQDDPVTVQLVADGFTTPAGIAFEPDGRLLLTDYATGELWRLTIPGATAHGDEIQAAGLGPDKAAVTRTRLGEFEPGLSSVAPDPRGHVYVANSQDGSVIKLYDYGARRVIRQGGLILPGGLTLCPNGAKQGEPLWVADAWTLRAYDRDTGVCCAVHRCNLADDGLTAPMTVSVDAADLIVSSWLGKVQVLDPLTCEMTESYSFLPLDDVPVNAIRYHGDVVVAGLRSGTVFRAADRSVLASGLDYPSGLAADDGDLWVADRTKGVVQWVAHDGVALAVPVTVAQNLDRPEGLAVLNGGALLVVEAGAGRLSRIDLEQGTVTALAEGLELGLEGPPGMPASWQFNDLTYAPDEHTVYVASDVTNRVYAIALAEDHGDLDLEEEAREP